MENRKKLQELKARADGGNDIAQFDYAWECLWEANEPPYDAGLVNEAVKYYTMSAEQGNTDAMLDLGALYLDGTKAFKADFDTAVAWYKRAADMNHPKAFRCMGYAMEFHGFKESFTDYEAAYRWFVKGALLGEENCLYELGDLYAGGHYVPEDKTFALALYQRSYEIINGVDRDIVRASDYLEECIEAGEYRLNMDVPIDWVDTVSCGLDEARRLSREIAKGV